MCVLATLRNFLIFLWWELQIGMLNLCNVYYVHSVNIYSGVIWLTFLMWGGGIICPDFCVHIEDNAYKHAHTHIVHVLPIIHLLLSLCLCHVGQFLAIFLISHQMFIHSIIKLDGLIRRAVWLARAAPTTWRWLRHTLHIHTHKEHLLSGEQTQVHLRLITMFSDFLIQLYISVCKSETNTFLCGLEGILLWSWWSHDIHCVCLNFVQIQCTYMYMWN